jgi:phage protein D
VTLALAFGWADSGIVNKGTFVVDEAEHSGPPDIITIRARSADLTRQIRTRRERSWHDTTLGAVLRTLAGDHALKAALAPALDAVALPHLDQGNESDLNLLTRLGKRFDAVATIKAGTLIFKPIDGATTKEGISLPVQTLTRASGDSHRYTVVDRDAVTGVRAYWGDRSAARRKAVLVGSSKNEKKLQQTYASESEARQHAKAELQRLARGTATLSFNLALGRADLFPGQRVSVAGIKPEIDGKEWLVVRATHTIDGGAGFRTAIELERSIDPTYGLQSLNRSIDQSLVQQRSEYDGPVDQCGAPYLK